MKKSPVLERLPRMSVKQRRDLARRAPDAANSDAISSEEARVVLAGIDDYEIELFRDDRTVVGSISWEPFRYQYVMRGFDGDREVARIIYTDTHGQSRKEVFKLVVLGTVFEDPIHHVQDARIKGSETYAERTMRE